MSIFTRTYWKSALERLKSVRVLAVCALLVALTIAITTLYIPLPNNLHVFFDYTPKALCAAVCGPVAALGLQTLSDPQGVQPIYAPAPVVRESVLKEYPQMAQWLQPVFASLDAKTLQQLNASIAVEGLDAKKVAADYLKQKGWTK